MRYPITLNGDHAEFESEWAASGRPPQERPDWPLPSFDPADWAKAFYESAQGAGLVVDPSQLENGGWVASWFANALMRGYDQRRADEGLFPNVPWWKFWNPNSALVGGLFSAAIILVATVMLLQWAAPR